MMHRIIVETERLILREFVLEDAAAFLVMCSNPEVTRYTRDSMSTLDEAIEGLRARPLANYAKQGYGRWACVLKETGNVIGFSGPKFLDELGEVELGYRLLPPFWGRGLATEAGRAVLDECFGRLGLDHVIGLVDPENVRSIHVLEKLGMRLVEEMPYFGGIVRKYSLNAS